MSESKEQHPLASALGLRLENGAPVLDSRSLSASLGGVLGVVESILPSFLFLILWVTTKSAATSIAGALLPVIFFGIFRLIRKQALMQVISGAVVAGFSAFLALRPGGSATDYFLPGLFTNIGYFAALSLSVVVRWPLVGVIFGFLFNHGTTWRKNKLQRSAYTAATLVLSGIFAIRLAFEVPLYLAGALEALATVKLILGIPLYALGLWTAWLVARKGLPAGSN